MTSLLAPAPVSKAKSRDAFALTITIRGLLYNVVPLDPGEDGTKAFRLTKCSGEGNVYDVIRTHDGLVACDCADYECRRKGLSAEPCKHGAACVAMGLLDAPTPVVAPEPRPSIPGVTRVRDEFDEPAPAPAPKPARVNASEWATKISGRYWEVATQEQRDAAVELLNRDYIFNVEVVPVAPSLEDLEAALLARLAGPAPEPVATPEAAPVACCSPAEVAPCAACVDGSEATAAPEPDRAEPEALTLAELIRAQARAFQAWGLDAGDLMAEALDELATEAEICGATNPAQLRDRRACLGRRERPEPGDADPIGGGFLGHDA